MIAAAIREVTRRGIRVEIAVPGGREIARRTFNPRLGIEGGLSILGTTGIVRPYCTQALRDALKCSFDVTAACAVTSPVLVPGNIGNRAARRHFALSERQIVEVGNEWGFVLDLLPRYAFPAVLILGHPGKLAKFAAGEWDTHSSRSRQGVELLAGLCQEILGHRGPDSPTVEGLMAALAASERAALGDELARRVRRAVCQRGANNDVGQIANLPHVLQVGNLPHSSRLSCDVAVFLVNMAGECLGVDGDLSPWQ